MRHPAPSSARMARPSLLAGLCLAALALGACASKIDGGDSPDAVVMKIGGDGYVIQPLTAGTWTATSQTQKPADKSGKADLIRAIESASGCKVTDSDYSNGNRQFDAQVECPSQIK